MDVNDGLTSFEKKQGAYISRGDLTEGVLRHKFREFNIFGEAYTWRSLWTNPFGERGILWVFEIDFFIVHKGLFSK